MRVRTRVRVTYSLVCDLGMQRLGRSAPCAATLGYTLAARAYAVMLMGLLTFRRGVLENSILKHQHSFMRFFVVHLLTKRC